MIRPLTSAAGVILLLFAVSGALASESRTWSSADGARNFEGRLKEYSPDTGQVTVILSNGQQISFSEEVLSPEDRKFLAEANATGATGATGATAMSSSAGAESVVGEQVKKARLHRLDGRRYRRAEIEKTPEFYLFYYSASW